MAERVTETNIIMKSLTDAEKKEKSTVMKNVMFLSVAFTFLFTSYFSIENLQSSFNKTDVASSQSAIYTSFIISCCFFPTLLVQVLREKLTLLVCSICYIAHIATHLYPNPYLLVPASVILGLAAGPLWAVQGSYITKAGRRYAVLTGEEASKVITRFFSIFSMFFQSTLIWSNLISSTAISTGFEKPEINDGELIRTCGIRFCNGEKGSENVDRTFEDHSNSTYPTLIAPVLWNIHALTAVCISGAVLSSGIIVFAVKPIYEKHHNETRRTKVRAVRDYNKSVLSTISATFAHMRNPYQILLVPLTIWLGVERAFIMADYTAAFISCHMGVHMIGYTVISHGICGVISSSCASFLVKVLGRIVVITLGFMVNLVLLLAMILWIPGHEQIVCVFVISGLWGVADGIWVTLINTLYGILFPKDIEAAFSNCRLWEAVGFALTIALSWTLCISSKIIFILAFLVLGVLGYYFIEFLEKIGGLPKDDEGKTLPIDRLLRSNR